MRTRDGLCEALRLIVKCGDCPRRGMVSLGHGNFRVAL